MAEEFGDVKAGFVGRTPGTQSLIGKQVGVCDGAEEIHPPFGALRLAVFDVEKGERDFDIADPCLSRSVQGGLGCETVRGWVRHEEMVERGTWGAVLRRVEYEGLISYVVWVDLILEVKLRIVGALVDEGFHDLVLPDIAIGALARIKVETGFVEGGERNGD